MSSSSGTSGKSSEDLIDAKFIAQFHLTQSFLDSVVQSISPPPAGLPGLWRALPLPEGSREAMEGFLNVEEKAKCKESTYGLRCAAFGPDPNSIYNVNVKFETTNYVVMGQWGFVAEKSKMSPNAVISLWGYRENGEPKFMFHLNGYAKEGEPLPPY